MRAMTTATDRLAAYLAAEAAVLNGQAFTVAGRSVTRADLGMIQKGITALRREVQMEQQAAAGVQSGCAFANFSGG